LEYINNIQKSVEVIEYKEQKIKERMIAVCLPLAVHIWLLWWHNQTVIMFPF
jgi:hypothetical protein